jgi:hypothetical protein
MTIIPDAASKQSAPNTIDVYNIGYPPITNKQQTNIPHPQNRDNRPRRPSSWSRTALIGGGDHDSLAWPWGQEASHADHVASGVIGSFPSRHRFIERRDCLLGVALSLYCPEQSYRGFGSDRLEC